MAVTIDNTAGGTLIEFFIEGQLESAGNSTEAWNDLEIRLGVSTWSAVVGNIDEAIISNFIKYTSNFTPESESFTTTCT